jgi:hypothetical protein
MKTCIITAASGYKLEDIKPWAESLTRSGYKGSAVVILYEENQEIAEYLGELGIFGFASNLQGLNHICTQRFQDYSLLLKNDYFKDIDYVIHVDIRDVIFQTDPEEWLLQNIGDSQILATSEGVTHRHEDWNGEGIQQNFGVDHYNNIADQEILCAGIIAGKRDTLIHLFTTLFELSFYTADLKGFTDQYHYNLAIRTIYKDVTKIIPADQPWVANLSTLIAIPLQSPEWSTGPRTNALSYERFRKGTFVENMKAEMPIMEGGIVYTADRHPYAIVHQYDRYAPWQKEILERLELVQQEETQTT